MKMDEFMTTVTRLWATVEDKNEDEACFFAATTGNECVFGLRGQGRAICNLLHTGLMEHDDLYNIVDAVHTAVSNIRQSRKAIPVVPAKFKS